MVDPTWTIHGADYDVAVDGLLNDFIDRRRGETVTLECEVRRRGPGSTVAAAETRYERLVNYHDFAGATDVSVDDQRVPYYRESVPSRADITSLLVGVEPNGTIAGGAGVWGIVSGGGERSRLFADMAVVELEIVVLAEYSEHTRSEVQTQFEEPL